MDRKQLNALFKKYNDGTCSEQEKALLESWYLQYHATKEMPAQNKFRAAKNLIFLQLPGNESGIFRIGYKIAAAAVLIGILITVLIKVMDSGKPNNLDFANDIPPGTNKAVLTLANGKHLNLSDANNGQLYQKKNIKIVKAQSGQIIFDYSGNDAAPEQNTISTPNGGQWQIKLPDGSQVWLNAASSLTFPTSFTHGINRIVKLSGEGYFEVSKDVTHPFIVISGDQRVEVLGTHFNISSYADDPSVKTTLLEGRVKVSLLGNATPKFLKPGEQSVAKGNQLEVKSVDAEEALAWRNGYFQFDDEPVNSIMRKLSRWYDVDVKYEGNISDEGLNGRVSRNKNISQVIKALEATQTVHFRLEGRRITVMK